MPPGKITSVANPLVKQVVQLRERKAREASGLTIVEGWREMQTALKAKVKFEAVYVCLELLKGAGLGENIFKEFKKSHVPMVDVSAVVFKKMAYGDRLDGILGVCNVAALGLDELKLSANPFLVVVEKVEKPGNLGAILRTADAAGVEALIVCDGATDIYNPNVIRASLGTVFSVAVCNCSRESLISFCRQKGIHLAALLPRGAIDYTAADLNCPIALLLGSEEKGLSQELIEKAVLKLRIPMKGMADSLNVSTSAAIVMYEALRQRNI